MNEKLKTTKLITVTGVLSALIIVVSFFPLKTLGLEITFSMVPVAIGGIMFGPAVGAILGGVFGLTSFIQCFGYSPFGALLLGESAFKTFLVCVPTRVLTGFLTGLIYKLFKNHPKISVLISSVAAPLMNTAFFMTTLVLCFYNSKFIQGYVETLNAPNPFVFIILFVGINGLVEIVAGIIIAYPSTLALKKALD